MQDRSKIQLRMDSLQNQVDGLQGGFANLAERFSALDAGHAERFSALERLNAGNAERVTALENSMRGNTLCWRVRVALAQMRRGEQVWSSKSTPGELT
jgi:hypothetical protein